MVGPSSVDGNSSITCVSWSGFSSDDDEDDDDVDDNVDDNSDDNVVVCIYFIFSFFSFFQVYYKDKVSPMPGDVDKLCTVMARMLKFNK